VSGRLVRTLSGQGSMLWDGRDEDRRPVPNGIYFAVPERGEGAGAKFVVVR